MPAPFPLATLLDDFTGVDQNPLARANWTNKILSTDGNVQLLSNRLAGISSNSGVYWSGAVFGPECDAHVTVPTKPASGQSVQIFARVANPGAAGMTGYRVRLVTGTPDSVTIQRHDSTASVVTLATFGSVTFNAGDKLGIRCYGATIEAWQFTAAAWTLLGGASDGTYGQAGNTGLRFTDTTATLDDIAAGNLPMSLQPDQATALYLLNQLF